MLPYLVVFFLCHVCKVVFTCLFSNFFSFFFSVFLLLLLQFGDVEDISEKKRAMGLGNVISEEREFSVSLETKDLLFYRLYKRQRGWKENLKITT